MLLTMFSDSDQRYLKLDMIDTDNQHPVTGIRRQYALLEPTWPQQFVFSGCYASMMRVGDITRTVEAIFLDHDLTNGQHRELNGFLVMYPRRQFRTWCEEVIDRLIANDLDKEWLDSTGFAQNLNQTLGVHLSCVFNFSPDGRMTDIMPNERYPLAFIVSQD